MDLPDDYDMPQAGIECIVRNCEHVVAEAAPQPDDQAARRIATAMGVTGAFFGDQHLYNEQVRIEKELDEHLGSHSGLDWVETVMGLKAALASAERKIKDLEARTCNRICCQGR